MGPTGAEGVGAVGPGAEGGQVVGQWDTKGAYPPPAMTEGGQGDRVRGNKHGGSGAVAGGAQHRAVPPPPALGTGTSCCHLARLPDGYFGAPAAVHPSAPAALPPRSLPCSWAAGQPRAPLPGKGGTHRQGQ